MRKRKDNYRKEILPMTKINELIFNELQEVAQDPMSNEYFMDNYYHDIVAKEAGYNSFAEIPEDKQDDVFNQDLTNIWLIPDDSLLMNLLVQYFNSRKNLEVTVRDGLDTDNGIYFVSGAGYDYISTDLLGSKKADENAKKKFINWCNQSTPEHHYYVIHDLPNDPSNPDLEPTVGSYYYTNLTDAANDAKQIAKENMAELSSHYDNLNLTPLDIQNNIPTGYEISNNDGVLESIYIESVQHQPKSQTGE